MGIVATEPDFLPGHAAAAWPAALRDAVRDPAELCQLLQLPAEWEARAQAAAQLFPLRVPRGFVRRMRIGDPHDPLLRQVLPLDAEITSPQGFTADPLEEAGVQAAPGLLHKYRGRALLITTGACAVHCRYCFRRHYPYDEGPHGLAAWQPAIDYLAADASIEEVLLSGGDPLSLVDSQLAQLAEKLAEIPHLQRLRVHTRWPIVIPERVDDRLLGWLCGTRLTPVVVVHANHARELDGTVAAAMSRLREAGVTLLNQAVLLRGVNDDVETLVDLSQRLLAIGVLPYYLHQLDRVAGAAHLEVAESVGLELMAELRRRLPGYLVPKYVRETPGAEHKVELRA
jgi:EF-P beta-lysylation protein EpmB